MPIIRRSDRFPLPIVVCPVVVVVMLESRVARCVHCVENVACIAGNILHTKLKDVGICINKFVCLPIMLCQLIKQSSLCLILGNNGMPCTIIILGFFYYLKHNCIIKVYYLPTDKLYIATDLPLDFCVFCFTS